MRASIPPTSARPAGSSGAARRSARVRRRSARIRRRSARRFAPTRGIATPAWLWVPAGVALLFLVLPILTLVVQAFGGGLQAFLATITSPDALAALGVSLRTSIASTVLCALFGIPLALLLARTSGPASQAVRIAVIFPLVIPPVVSGVALLYLWGRFGWLGSALDVVGVRVGFSEVAVVFAQVFVALPFMVLTAETAIRSVDPQFEVVAASSGASATRIVRSITLPLALPGVLAACVLTFARALGEYGATITFAGSIAGVTRTLPLQVELNLNSPRPETSVGLSLVLLAICTLVLVGLRLATTDPLARMKDAFPGLGARTLPRGDQDDDDRDQDRRAGDRE
ncbi:ABC transporter permease [Planctomonas psychrotolerans]|uniref:ABC transporter permease n=1 Tax=Planctomonas psychrotolerans TaxID=2528712 RepID=UPI001239756B|nr:ABC transporter permease [Planctomonas psychrotolerans]